MTIQQCYHDLGGDYEKTQQRLSNADMIRRFLLRFPEDGTFLALSAAMEAGEWERAFSCAHTLEGVCANLGLDALLQAALPLTEALRTEESISGKAMEHFARVREEYARTIGAIRRFQQSGEEQ